MARKKRKVGYVLTLTPVVGGDHPDRGVEMDFTRRCTLKGMQKEYDYMCACHEGPDRRGKHEYKVNVYREVTTSQCVTTEFKKWLESDDE